MFIFTILGRTQYKLDFKMVRNYDQMISLND